MEKRTNTGMALFPRTIAKLDDTATRLGMSRAAVVELLVWKCSDHLRPVELDESALAPGGRGKRGNGRRKPRTTPPPTDQD